ncbi:hypothetical protein LCGC14_0330030 [marine sediment metagenome]|uniref:Uncharacterized protein n=1 Tax=marine sediment metagenome TaxID=412755 RepID=A0A0F9TGQ5_9ZZZZ
MARARETEESRRKAVEWFLARRSRASLDGSVYTDGNTLCVGRQHVAFWHQSVVYLVYMEFPGSLVRDIKTMIRLGEHGHTVAETGGLDVR